MSSDSYVDPAAVFDARQAAVEAAPTRPTYTDAQIAQLGVAMPAVQAPSKISIGPAGVVQTPGVESYNSAQSIGDGSAGIVSTGRSPFGSPRAASELQPTDMVEIPGAGLTTVRTAERLGFIKVGAHGLYEDVTTHPNWNEIEKAPEARKEENEAFDDPAADAALSAFATKVDPGTQVKGLMQIIESGGLEHHTMMTAASAMGVPPAAMEGTIGRIMDAFDRQARQAVEKHGVEDADEFFEWAEKTHKGRFTDARRRHAMERTSTVYADLAREFVRNRAKTNFAGAERAVQDAGATTRKGPNGVLLVNIPNLGETTYEAAVAAGFLKPNT